MSTKALSSARETLGRMPIVTCTSLIVVMLLVNLVVVHDYKLADLPLGPRKAAENVLELPRCDRLLFYRTHVPNGFGSQFIRIFSAFRVAEAMESSLSWLPSFRWNYGCNDDQKNWDCYFEPLRPRCRVLTDDKKWISMSSDKFAQAYYDGEPWWPAPEVCSPISDISRGKNTSNTRLWSNDKPGERSCHSIYTLHDSDICVQFAESELDPLSAKEAIMVIRRTTRKIWRLLPAAREYIRKHQRDLWLNFADAPLVKNSNYISVHLRRGDKVWEVPEVPLDFYEKSIRYLANDSGLNRVFIASDDGKAPGQLADRLGPNFTVMTLPSLKSRVGHSQSKWNNDKDWAQVMDLLSELEIMSGGAYFLGTSSSALARVVHMLRPIDESPDSSIFIDRIFRPGLPWKKNHRYCDASIPPEVSGANQRYCNAFRDILSKAPVQPYVYPEKSVALDRPKIPLQQHPFFPEIQQTETSA